VLLTVSQPNQAFHVSTIGPIAASASNRFALSIDDNMEFRIWRTDSFECVSAGVLIGPGENRPSSVAISDAGTAMIVCEKTVSFVDLAGGVWAVPLEGVTAARDEVGTNRFLLLTGATIFCCDPVGHTLNLVSELQHDEQVVEGSFRFSFDGKLVLMASRTQGKLSVWESKAGSLEAVHHFGGPFPELSAISSDFTAMATIQPGRIQIQSLGLNQTNVTIPTAEESEIYRLALSESGSLVATASLDNSKLFLRHYDVATGVCLSENQFENEIQTLQFLPKSKDLIGVANARALYPIGFRDSLFLSSSEHSLVVRNRAKGGGVGYSGVAGFCVWSDSTFARIDLRSTGFSLETFNDSGMLCGASNDRITVHSSRNGLVAVDTKGQGKTISSETFTKVVLQHNGDLFGVSREIGHRASELNVYDVSGSLLWKRATISSDMLAVTSKYLVWAVTRDRIVRCDVRTGINEIALDDYPHYKIVPSRDGQYLAIRLAPEGLALFDVERFVPVWEVREGVKNITCFGVGSSGDVAIAFSDRAMFRSKIQIWSDGNVCHSITVAGCLVDLLWLDADHLVVVHRNETCELVRIVDGEVLDSFLLAGGRISYSSNHKSLSSPEFGV
jgi:WD40 repeat protein